MESSHRPSNRILDGKIRTLNEIDDDDDELFCRKSSSSLVDSLSQERNALLSYSIKIKHRQYYRLVTDLAGMYLIRSFP